MEFYVYVLKLKKINGYYTGLTQNPRKRISNHKYGYGAKVTKKYGVRSVISIKRFSTFQAASYEEQRATLAFARLGFKSWGSAWTMPSRPLTRKYVNKRSLG